MADCRDRQRWRTALLGCKGSRRAAVAQAAAHAAPWRDRQWIHGDKKKRMRTVKKLIVLAVVALGLAVVWRKVQADRAELDLWTEATTADD